MLDVILSLYQETDEEYIEDCKLCFNKEPIEIQKQIEEADTDELDNELKKHNWTTAFDEYCRAIKYELMLRNDFKKIN